MLFISHLVLWLNDKSQKLEIIFGESLVIILKKIYFDIASIDKYSMLCADILEMENIKSYEKIDNLIYIITLKHLTQKLYIREVSGDIFTNIT